MITTYAWLHSPPKADRLAQLSMVFWGLTFMIFVDHVIGWFLEGAEGDFLEIGTEEFMLSLCMIIPILMIWEGLLLADKFKLRQIMESKNKTENEEVI